MPPIKFYVCSVGDPTKDYAKENLNRILTNSAFILHQDARQKGVYEEIEPGSIVLLKFDKRLIAYGKSIVNRITHDEGWNLWTDVKEWHFKNPENIDEGIPLHGIAADTIAGGPYGTVKEVSTNFGWQKLQEINSTTSLHSEVKQLLSMISPTNNISEMINLLKYKKQIILQGPPGTGKTYTAKEIANALISIGEHGEKLFPDVQEIRELSREGDKVLVTNGVHESVVIVKLNVDTFSLQGTGRETFRVSYAKVADSIITMNPHPVGKDVYPSALAKYIIQKWTARGNIYEEGTESASERIKLIQFHPAYSYEDFVRGIVASSNGIGVEYVTKNKILAEFAKTAYTNFVNSKKSTKEVSEEAWVSEQLDNFTKTVESELRNGQKYRLNESVYIFETTIDGDFRYTGDNWGLANKFKIKRADVLAVYLNDAIKNSLLKKLANVSGSAKQNPTYVIKLVEKFKEFVNGKPRSLHSVSSSKEMKYILIIDEINRANLPAVLGELIYALEYRGKPVESTYDIDGDRTLVLPPNLFIIGTMNTADRSVGHIDYAIRRRFAFVDVLPSPVPVHAAAKNLFKQVSELFVSDYDLIDWQDPKPKRSQYVATDFRPEDIWIGHSYFMSDKQDDEGAKAELEIRLKYEILPLLKEYVKDGLLLPEAEEMIKKLHV